MVTEIYMYSLSLHQTAPSHGQPHCSRERYYCTTKYIAEVDEGVLAQLRAKHPERGEPVPAAIEGDFTRHRFDLTEHFRRLRRSAGAGPDGCRNEYRTARMQHAITAQREAAAARRLDVLMLALPRTDPRRHAWLEAGDAAQIAGRWLASHPSERLGLVCSCSEFSEMLVSYLGVDSPAASSPGVLGASFSGYSGGRQRFVVDAGGWEVERVQMPGDGWRDAHDYIASTVFDLVSLAGITGTMEPRGIFSMAVPAEVLAAALAEDGSRRSRPGAVPDYCFTVDGRRMLYDVKRISFCPSRYWPTVAVASSRGGPLEYRASSVRAEYEAAAAALDARTAAWYVRTGTAAPVGAPTAVDILASFPPVRGLVFGSTACGGSREVGILLAQAASSSAQRQWRSLGARSMLDARSFMISTLRSQVGFAAAVAHARLRLSRLELIGGSGRTAGRYASAARAFISPTAFEQARGGALGAGGGRVGFAGGGLF